MVGILSVENRLHAHLDIYLQLPPVPYIACASDLHALTYRTPRLVTWTSWTRIRCGQRTCSGDSWPCSSCCCKWSRAGWAEMMRVGSTEPRPWWCCSRMLCRGLWCRWQSRFLEELQENIISTNFPLIRVKKTPTVQQLSITARTG